MSEPTSAACELTDEQIDSSVEWVADHFREWSGEPAPRVLTDFHRLLTAVEARAARRERKRLWRAIDPLMDTASDRSVRDRLARVGTPPNLRDAYQLGLSTALMEIARGTDHD